MGTLACKVSDTNTVFHSTLYTPNKLRAATPSAAATSPTKQAAAEPARLRKLGGALGEGDVGNEALLVGVERVVRAVGGQLGPHLVAAARLAREVAQQRLARVGPLELAVAARAALRGARVGAALPRRRRHVTRSRWRHPPLARLEVRAAPPVGEQQRAAVGPAWLR